MWSLGTQDVAWVVLRVLSRSVGSRRGRSELTFFLTMIICAGLAELGHGQTLSVLAKDALHGGFRYNHSLILTLTDRNFDTTIALASTRPASLRGCKPITFPIDNSDQNCSITSSNKRSTARCADFLAR